MGRLVARMMTDVIYTVPMLKTLNLHQYPDKNQLRPTASAESAFAGQIKASYPENGHKRPDWMTTGHADLLFEGKLGQSENFTVMRGLEYEILGRVSALAWDGGVNSDMVWSEEWQRYSSEDRVWMNFGFTESE